MAAAKKQKRQELPYRPPIVALLGHVDHGKTTILDNIRTSSVQAGEEGGITQGISVYSIERNGKAITFVDTPGHEAFDLMRKRGGLVADIVLLIVGANDGVKPQTKESIDIIKESGKPCIAVLNKVDISGVDIEKVKRDLSTEGIVVESMGGDVPCVEVSGKTGKGIPDLLEMIQLVAEISQISAKEPPQQTVGEAVVLESQKDKSRGNVSTIVVTAGKFVRGSRIAYVAEGGRQVQVEKIKGCMNDVGDAVDVLSQGYGGEVIGLKSLVPLGDVIYSVTEEGPELKKLLIDTPPEEIGTEIEIDVPADTEPTEPAEPVTGGDLLSMLLTSQDEKTEEMNALRIVVKTNTQGTCDAIMKSLHKSIKDGIVDVVRAEVGNITVNDVEFAANLGAIVVGFRVDVDPVAEEVAGKRKLLAKVYQIIYELVDEVNEAAADIQLPDESEEVIGQGRIKKIFILSNGSKVLGTRVDSGEIKQGNRCRISREGDIIADTKIVTMRCEKESIHEAGKGMECGLFLDGDVDAQEGDTVECYRIVKS